MKKLFDIFLGICVIYIILYVSLNPNMITDNRKEIISDYVQSIGYIKINLGFKTELIKNIKTITVKDSLHHCDSIMTIPVTPNKVTKESVNKFLKECDTNIEYYKKTQELTDLIMWAYLKNNGLLYLKYKDMDSTKVLSNVVRCDFSIVNPYVKGERIKLSKIFYFTPDNKKILKVNNI